jgi:hypothetical protein
MRVLKTIIAGAVLSGCLAGPVYAQGKGAPKDETPMQLEEKQKQRDAESIDRQYKSTLQKTRSGGNTAAAPADDPWSNMRGGGDTKPKR